MISNELGRLIELAVAAGREIMAVHDAGVSATSKADGSPVTIADQRAEAVILAGLADLAPDVPVLAEEESAAGRTPVIGERFFCVDPLDGTKDFISGGPDGVNRGEFTVNIALIEHGTPTIGVVFAPATHALYAGELACACKGEWNARAMSMIAPLAPISVAPAQAPWRVTTSRRHGGDSAANFIRALGATVEVRASSSIKFCLVAEGACDLYPRFGPVSEWDAAAGHAVLKAAGGDLIRLNGEPVTYGRAAKNFLIDGFIAYGDAHAEAAARTTLTASGA